MIESLPLMLRPLGKTSRAALKIIVLPANDSEFKIEIYLIKWAAHNDWDFKFLNDGDADSFR